MTISNKSWSEMTMEPMTKAEFFQIAGISPELAEFVDEFIKKPEVLESLPLERQQQIEEQMDAVLALFGKHHGTELAGNERRRERRIRVSWPIEFFQFCARDAPKQAAVAIDLSREGLRLKTDIPLKTGMNLCVRIQEMNHPSQCIEETCLARNLSVSEVKWCRKINSEEKSWYHAGIKYVLSDDA